jgi:hypothetical protein
MQRIAGPRERQRDGAGPVDEVGLVGRRAQAGGIP